jgi:hypothetical protein
MAKKKKRTKKKLVKRKVTKKVTRKVVRKVTRKSSAKKRPVKKKTIVKKPKKENVVGIVTHYFSKVQAGVVKLKAPLAVGDMIKIKGHTTDFKQQVASMQIDRVPINQAKKGQEIGILVDSRVRQHDTVYKI